MKYGKKQLSVVLAAFAFVPQALAQEDESAIAPDNYIYSTYHHCEVTKQDRADDIVKQHQSPVYRQMREEGLITGWGWLAHHTGGHWRRLGYFAAPSLNALLDAQDSFAERMEASAPKAGKEMGKICSAHDDYIWKYETGKAVDSSGAAVFSTYFICDETREARADEIVKEHFAPIMNRFVDEGRLSGWGWLSHWVGGKYRRLQTIAAKDMKTVLAARDALIGELYAEGSETGEEFTKICGSHSDYMWMVVDGR